ncbi:hypothetical protein BGX23_003014 [Mortierella sp. AD031]|nr:hypothetical protein BGX23_003014 [Mortierella sp. AD031]
MDNSEDGEIETEVEVNSGIAGEIITIGDQSKSPAARDLDVGTAADGQEEVSNTTVAIILCPPRTVRQLPRNSLAIPTDA